MNEISPEELIKEIAENEREIQDEKEELIEIMKMEDEMMKEEAENGMEAAKEV